MDEKNLPAHLREDAPFLRCDQCRRKTWALRALNTRCGMTQPDGQKCEGTFKAET